MTPKSFSTLASVLAVLLVALTGPAWSQACPLQYATPLKKGEPHEYFADAGRLMKRDGLTGQVQEVRIEGGKVSKVRQSRLNCDLQLRMQREPNVVAVLFEDGHVAVRARLHFFNIEGMPILRHDSGRRWLPLGGVQDAVDLAVGETRVDLLRRDGSVWHWGRHENLTLAQGLPSPIGAELWARGPKPVEGAPKTQALYAFNEALYLLTPAGELYVVGRPYFDPQRKKGDYYGSPGLRQAYRLTLPPSRVQAFEMTGAPVPTCRATLATGQRFAWPCDLTDPFRNSLPQVQPREEFN